MTATHATGLPLLVVTHVPWEGPHRILDALAGVPVLHVRPLDGEPLPDPSEVRGAVVMGGPMSANDTAALPGLAGEIAWLARAVGEEVPVLGICLGAELLARALGAAVRPAAAPEIGWAPVDVVDPRDALLGPLAPRTDVLHWHGEVFDLPAGAVALARSSGTAVQAFRYGPSAWGILFHIEADAALVDRWLAEPSMVDEAVGATTSSAAEILRAGAGRHGQDLAGRSTRSLAAFARLCRRRADGRAA